jgi:predicted chitinase
MITEQQLRKIMPNLGAQKLQLYLPHLNTAMQSYGVNSMQRTAAFVAQLAHESAEFRFMEELWGPIPAQVRYEPQSELARRLGNIQAGDGKRFKGRGPIQITGRFNYQKYGDLLGLDLVDRPELAAQPEVAFATAGLFWKTNGLNELADAGDFVAITKRINGGTNGLAERERYHARALQALADGFVPAPAGAARGPMGGAPKIPSEPLLRGHEAIVGMPEVASAQGAPIDRPSARTAPIRRARIGVARERTGATKRAAKKGRAKPQAAEDLTAPERAARSTVTNKPSAKKLPVRNPSVKNATAKRPATRRGVARRPTAKASDALPEPAAKKARKPAARASAAARQSPSNAARKQAAGPAARKAMARR